MPSGAGPTVSVIVTAHNDATTIARVVLEAIPILADQSSDFEIIVVDDASADETGALAERIADDHPCVRVIRNEHNLGFGGSYLRAVQVARFEYVLLMCGDGGLPTRSLPPILSRIGEADIIIPHMPNLRELKT